VIRAGLLKPGSGIPGQLSAADPGYRGPRVPCGHGHEAVLAACRDKVIDTVPGPVMLHRAWYHCAACGPGLAPRDAGLGVAGTSLSPGLTVMTDKAAAAGPFAGAASMIEDLAGVHLTVKRVERAAEASGAAHAGFARERAMLIADRKVVPLPPSPLPDMLYGPIAAFESARVFADLVKTEGIRRGADHVRQLTIIGDGAGSCQSSVDTARITRTVGTRAGPPGRRRPDRSGHAASPPSALMSLVPFQANGHPLPASREKHVMPREGQKCRMFSCRD
jgi:hypothetical protein